MNKIIIALAAVFITGGLFFLGKVTDKKVPIINQPSPLLIVEEESISILPIDIVSLNLNEEKFETITLLSTNPGRELTKIVGIENVFTVLAINRIDDRNLLKGMTLVIPKSFNDPNLWEFMPNLIEGAENIPKLVIIYQPTQAFGFYEKGQLIRSGPVSSGKLKTPTPTGLYFMNWKGEEVTSTFSDEWILKWNFNISNKEGIALHQYALPGYPASHSCVRLYSKDAEWLYNWGEQWILAEDGQTMLASGTPVIIYGLYDFNNNPPWKDLPINREAVKVPKNEINEIVKNSLLKIEKEQMLKDQLFIIN